VYLSKIGMYLYAFSCHKNTVTEEGENKRAILKFVVHKLE